MKIAFQLAYKNLVGAGLRTWLNVSVLSFAFVVIIFYNGLIDGWNLQARNDGIAWEYGNGHLLNEAYDPYDPLSIQLVDQWLPLSPGTYRAVDGQNGWHVGRDGVRLIVHGMVLSISLSSSSMPGRCWHGLMTC